MSNKRCNTVVNTCFLLDLPDELLEKILKLLIDPVEFQADLPKSFLRFAVTTKQVCHWRTDRHKNVIEPLWDGYKYELQRKCMAIKREYMAIVDKLRRLWESTEYSTADPRAILEPRRGGGAG
jgi:hypothetical protein